MRRIICLLLVLALCLPLVLTACKDDKGKDRDTEEESEIETGNNVNVNPGNSNNEEQVDGDEENEPDADEDEDPDNDPADEEQNGGEQTLEPDNDLPAGAKVKKTYTFEKQYLTDAVASKIENDIEGSSIGTSFYTPSAPFVLKGDLGLGNAKLTSITIPVGKTISVDDDGNFVFTISVYDKISSLSAAATAQPKTSYNIKISASAYGLPISTDRNLNKIIKVDVRDYNICLKSTETLGFSRQQGDTLWPLFFFANNDADKSTIAWLGENCSVMKGFYAKVGNGGENNESALFFDFTYENTYDSYDAYAAEVDKEFIRNGGTYKLNVPYMSAQTHEMVNDRVVQKELNGAAYGMGGAPYAPQNPGEDIGLSGTKLTSITIPVMSTGASENGHYKFTLSVVNKDNLLTTNAITRTIPIYISKSYGLIDNAKGIYKFITVDLSAYNIVIGDDETIAFGASGDTLFPIFAINSKDWDKMGIYNYLAADPIMGSWKGFVKNVGKSVAEDKDRYDSSNIIFFDFTYEKVYTTSIAYLAAADCNINEEFYYENFDEMLQAVKDAYGGKQLSIMGDSISTYEGVTVEGNAIWYGSGAIAQSGFSSHLDTYWGNMIEHIAMKLCVDNAWSGDSVCGDISFGRAENLANGETKPDLILMYFGINDTGNNKAVGELYDLLQNRGSKTRDQVVKEWFEEVLKDAENKGFSTSGTSTFKGSMCSSWSEGYALLLYLMTQKYSNAKIVLFELVDNGAFWSNGYVNSKNLVPQYNTVISALADYFDLPVVRQYELITEDNYEFYMHDCRLIHPNADGHELMFKELIYTLYTDLQKNKK